ncbi:hypothetical protein K432DRAFT_473410 [Lepidopterella palustris CBS 459.81]|uniref:Uncharacterized protein n=1 Tax=Lepidopterella palustris CBS 459.81 TaxID=1314670 RepID=A0A8E2J8N2_9PEZI|nr:hypothetical protein K432DRAFT_473410 [Lepidopterella palustris CBS 459.81]
MALNNDIATEPLLLLLSRYVEVKPLEKFLKKTGKSVRQINRTYARVIKRGFNPNYVPFTL